MARLTEHVVLISVDGLRPQIYRDKEWPAPVLHEMAHGGAIALAARSVFPALTYPAHVTIVTGALPARHGVVDNEPFEPLGRSGRWVWEASAIRLPTLWDAVRSAGGTTASISWPVTVGAAIDWNVPDVWSPSHPASIEPIRAATTPGLLEELERQATGRLSDATFSLDSLEREDTVGAMASYLFQQYRPTLMLVHIIGLDHVRHRLGGDNPRARRAVAAADRAIARIVETVERVDLVDRTTFIVTGDHGSVDSHTALLPNAWLNETGISRQELGGTEWRANFHASGGSAFLRIQPGAAAADTAAAVRSGLADLPRGIRALFRIVERPELDELGADPDAVFALAAEPGVVFSPERVGSPIQAAHGAGHGYHPDLKEMLTGFVAAGPGVRPGAVVPMLPLEYIAPFIASLLGLAMPAVDGALFPGLLSTTPESAPSRRP
jgi:predicted AlkP superfamily pyrophosphatase or phosphodiesterase